MIAREPRMRSRRGITLTEILIAIMILGVGLVSLATLFPIGLLRLRDAARSSRTKYLVDSASADGSARSPFPLAPDGTDGGLLNPNSFVKCDFLNFQYGVQMWYVTALGTNQSYGVNPNFAGVSPLTQDTPGYGLDYFIPATPPAVLPTFLGANSPNSGGYGLPFAYDPLWRQQTLNPLTGTFGYYLGDGYANPGVVFEARFGSGIGFIRSDPSDGGLPSAHGLQRVTNFNRPTIQPVSFSAVPSTFVSQEDVVWVEALQSNVFSPVLPDLQLKSSLGAPSLDWRYSWMFTGYQVSSAGGATFEGNIVIFENRPFGISAVPNPQGPGIPTGTYQVDGETVVEAIFGHSANIVPAGGPGYGAGADKTVLLRWYSSVPDPVVKPGDWIADVTYERNALTVLSRFQNNLNAPPGVPNPFNNNELDNLPAQRCYWYQVQKVIPAIDDPYTAGQNLNPPLRSMVVYVDRSLIARTVLSAAGTPVVYNAAMISPYVVNVIPQQFTVK